MAEYPEYYQEELAKLRAKVAKLEATPSLQAARNLLKDYFDKHRMGVKEVIYSEWARGVVGGRQEAINLLDEVIARQKSEIV